MKENPLQKLESFGQSIWMDLLQRGLITSGELKRLIEEDGLSGVTSNPSIFQKAVEDSHDYDDAIQWLAREGKSAEEIYASITIEDIQHAADLLRPTYDGLEGADGFVSLEVSPHLAYDTSGTIDEARKLWAAVARPNVMIKVPATRQGLPAIERLIGEGININITLLFGLPRYREVANAYMSGLEALARQGKPLVSVSSVASFFLSRIDTLIDPMLEAEWAKDPSKATLAAQLHGQTAILSAKAAYRIYMEIVESERFAQLKLQGARVQRLLWASTSTKNPAYSDLKYIEPLIGPDTINTMPMETLKAYRDHGVPAQRLLNDAEGALGTLQRLPEMGIDLDAATQQLEDEGVKKFLASLDDLINVLAKKRAEAVGETVGSGKSS
jgi:transaldolase